MNKMSKWIPVSERWPFVIAIGVFMQLFGIWYFWSTRKGRRNETLN